MEALCSARVCECVRVCAGGSCHEGVGGGGERGVGGGLCGPADAPGARGARDEEVKNLLFFSADVESEKQRQGLRCLSLPSNRPTDQV